VAAWSGKELVGSAVTERGMLWWKNGVERPMMSPHVVSKSYLFHGTFNNIGRSDFVSYDDVFTFLVNVDGATGSGRVHMWGSVHFVHC
jgi:hypothetical protein